MIGHANVTVEGSHRYKDQGESNEHQDNKVAVFCLVYTRNLKIGERITAESKGVTFMEGLLVT